MIKSLFLLSVFGLVGHAQASVFYAPSSATCRPDFGGSFKFCDAQTVEIGFDRVTPSSSDYLQNMSIDNVLQYRLFCPAWPDRVDVELEVLGQNQTLVGSSKALVESVSKRTNIQDLATSAYQFLIRPARETTLQKICSMEVVSNVSYPDLGYLDTLANVFLGESRVYNSLFDKVSPGPSAAVLLSSIQDAQSTLELLISISAADELASQQYEALQSSLNSAYERLTQACEGGSASFLCTDEVAATRQAILDERADLFLDKAEVKAFAASEQSRLLATGALTPLQVDKFKKLMEKLK